MPLIKESQQPCFGWECFIWSKKYKEVWKILVFNFMELDLAFWNRRTCLFDGTLVPELPVKLKVFFH